MINLPVSPAVVSVATRPSPVGSLHFAPVPHVRRALLAGLTLLACLAAEAAAGKCLRPAACYLVAFETSACEAPPLAPPWVTDPREHHVALTVSVDKVTPVPCHPGAAVEGAGAEAIAGIGAARKFFYANHPGDVCAWFKRHRAELFLAAQCCDLVPPVGACALDAPVLRDVPPQALSERR